MKFLAKLFGSSKFCRIFALEKNDGFMKHYWKLEIMPIKLELESGFLFGSASTDSVKFTQADFDENTVGYENIHRDSVFM